MFKYLEKQDKVYREKEMQLKKLGEKIELLKEKIVDSKTEKQYREELMRLTEQYDKIKKSYHSILLARFLDFDDSVYAIAYLIEKIEGKTYSVKEFSTKLYQPTYPIPSKPNYSIPKEYDYKICYLVTEEKEEEALQELKSRFTISDINNEDNYYNIIEGLRNPSENYIQIAYYKKNNPKKIDFTFNNFACAKAEQDTFIISQLCDERYAYILDYVEMLIEHRLDDDNLQISLDEMLAIADNYAQEYKNKPKKLQK